MSAKLVFPWNGTRPFGSVAIHFTPRNLRTAARKFWSNGSHPWTRTWSGRSLWNRGKYVRQPASSSKRFLRSFFFYFWVGRYNKTLKDWSCRKPPQLFPRENWRSQGNKAHCFLQDQSLLYIHIRDQCPTLNRDHQSGLTTCYHVTEYTWLALWQCGAHFAEEGCETSS